MKSAEELEKDWWARWWDKDFSWEGQDDDFRAYWALEEDDLYKSPVSAKRFTRFHLPLEWENGEPTDKASWAEEEHLALADALEQLLEQHRGEDNPAPFSGMVLKRVPNMPKVDEASPNPASIELDNAWLQPGTTWKAQVFATALFNSARFGGNPSFNRAQFSGYVGFFDARFVGLAWFTDARFGSNARFQGAQFSQQVRFSKARFSYNAWFDDAQFSSTAWFDDAQFRGDASFRKAQFSGRAWFESAQFGSNASFEGARFSGNAWFTKAQFSGDARLNTAEFSGDALFDDAIFRPGSEKFPNAALHFADAQFHKTLVFRPGDFPTCPSYAAGAFFGAHFEQNAFFDSQAFFAVEAFDGASTEKQIRLHQDYAERKASSTPQIVRKKINAALEIEDEGKRDRALRAIAGGARVLQIAMDKARNREGEQLFHRMEVLARKHRRPRWSSRRLLTGLYGLTSDYGGSVGKPLLSVVAVAVFLTFVYAGGYESTRTECAPRQAGVCGWDYTRDGLVAAATFSGRNALIAMPAWREKTDDEINIASSLFTKASFEEGAGDLSFKGLFWRSLITAQSLFSIIMLFLSGLAARRYYQLS